MLFGYSFANVVRFLSMNQMMMEIERIVRFHLASVSWATSTEILIDMGGVVVDDDNHPAVLCRFFHLPITSGFFQKLAQSRNFLHAKVVGIRPLEKYAFATDAEREFIVSMRLDLTQMLNQFYRLAPAEIMRQLAVE